MCQAFCQTKAQLPLRRHMEGPSGQLPYSLMERCWAFVAFVADSVVRKTLATTGGIHYQTSPLMRQVVASVQRSIAESYA